MSTTTKSEPHNPFYLLLLIASMFFVVTALAYALIPTLETTSETPSEPSAIRKSLNKDGWIWLVIELAVMIALAFASMFLDRSRLRRLQNDDEQAKMPAESEIQSKPVTESSHVSEERDREAAEGDRSA